MEFTEQALVLRTGRFREADAWLRLLTPTRGVLTAFAFGGMKSRRRFPGCLDPLNLVLFKFGSDRRSRFLNLEEGTLLHGHPSLRKDSRCLGVAVNCLKFTEKVQIGPEGATESFDLLLELLALLEQRIMQPERLPLLYRARLGLSQGYRPDFMVCGDCGLQLNAFDNPCFFVEKGQVLCPSCRTEEERSTGLDISSAALRALEWIMTHPPGEWPRLTVPSQVRREFSLVVERFVAYHLGLEWDGGLYRNV
ncbi:MAG: DNA repair protein RecO [Desulfovibrionaceae bacterium]